MSSARGLTTTGGPGTTRSVGRPRSAAARQAVRDATLAELAERGVLGLRVERVAERAGVAKTTIYRWWPDTVALALDALRSLPPLPSPDTGSLAGDLDELRTGLLDLLASSSLGAVLPVLISERRRASAHRDVIGGYIDERAAPWLVAVRRAMARGELPVSADAELVAGALAGPLTHSILFRNDPLDPDRWHRLVTMVVAGVHAVEDAP